MEVVSGGLHTPYRDFGEDEDKDRFPAKKTEGENKKSIGGEK